MRVENGGGGGPTGRDHAQSAAGPGGSGGGDTPPPFGGEVGCRRGRMTSPRQSYTRTGGPRGTARVRPKTVSKNETEVHGLPLDETEVQW